MIKRLNIKRKQCWSLLFLLLFCGNIAAKKNKIRSCTLPNGEVVLMDKACPNNSRTNTYKKPKKEQSNIRQKHWHQSPIKQSSGKQKSRKPAKTPNRNQAQTPHVPEQSLALNRLLASVKAPKQWFIQSFKLNRGDVITASPKRLTRPQSLRTGATLSRHTNTIKHYKKDAFSVAIDQFHEIRFNDKNDLIESEFIAHKRFKVFNVHYIKKRLRQQSVRYLVQFYVDEKNNDLYVLEFKSPSQHWSRLSNIRTRLFNSVAI